MVLYMQSKIWFYFWQILWFHNNQPIDMETTFHLQLTSGGRRLQIASALVSDTGLYQCIATNEAGEAEERFELQVWGRLGSSWWNQWRKDILVILLFLSLSVAPQIHPFHTRSLSESVCICRSTSIFSRPSLSFCFINCAEWLRSAYKKTLGNAQFYVVVVFFSSSFSLLDIVVCSICGAYAQRNNVSSHVDMTADVEVNSFISCDY